MAKIVVECTDPNDLDAVEAASEQFVGRCNVTYFKQAKALQDAGTANSERDAARQIASETGETEKAVQHRIQRGKKEMPQDGAKPPTVGNEKEKSGDTGDISRRVDEAMKAGKSEREASKVVAEKTGKSVSAVKKAHQRQKKKTEPPTWECAECGKKHPLKRKTCPCQENARYATEAMDFAAMSISQLERIRHEDPKRIEAFKHVAQWIKLNMPSQ